VWFKIPEDNFLPDVTISVDLAHKTEFADIPYKTEVLLSFHRSVSTQLIADLLLKHGAFFKKEDVILISFFI